MKYYYSMSGTIYNEDEVRAHKENELLYGLEVTEFIDIVNIIYNDIITYYECKFYRAYVKDGDIIIKLNGGVDEYDREIRDIKIIITCDDVVIDAQSTTSSAGGDNDTFHIAYADYEFDKLNDLIHSLWRPIIDQYAYDDEYDFSYHEEIIDDDDD